ncbi:MAG: histidine phosphatase family protein [Candidatus Tectomicrobia bacterium]|uniref:Histidine phosphatase family protein n=1 Tax=Tectimicrobiota bacterium TaxID=2528274 RepID=A0A938B0Q5_UNCTE|nr:histidine phosphatase family protein [Candidatus Tectomicrobia bacterium]
MSTAERLIYVVRHGATDWNHSGRIQGHMDVPLNETGRAQARLASRRLAAVGATALYSSDLARAAETAQIIGHSTGLQVTQRPGLREIHFGVWQGLSSPEIRERDPEVYAARRANPYDVAPAGAETWRNFYARALQTVEEILAQTDAERLIMVTHSGVCTVMGLRALGFDCTGKRTFDSHNCGIHTIAVQGVSWRAVMLNDIAHLTSAF